MNYLHRRNPPIVHRDLKSANLLVDKKYTVKVRSRCCCCASKSIMFSPNNPVIVSINILAFPFPYFCDGANAK